MAKPAPSIKTAPLTPPPGPPDMATSKMESLLRGVFENKASDLHLTVGLPPQMRVDGKLTPISDKALMPEDTQALAYQVLTPDQITRFEKTMELDTAYSLRGVSRFRVNCYRQRGSIGLAARVIPFEIPKINELGLPDTLLEFCTIPSGLVIVSGPTGSGKSTTLASMIDVINQTRNCHIVSVEDPIEYLHKHQKATINQRELGVDTTSFTEALRHVVRQDPDVILIGEMRDLETMQTALTLAETGHLVLSTLHTADAPHTVNRIVDVFPPYQQQQVRTQLSLVLVSVIVQQLFPKTDGKGRAVACEIMRVTPAIGALIRENHLHQIRSVIQTGKQHGMVTLNQSMADLYTAGVVSWEEIARRSPDVIELKSLTQSKPQKSSRRR